MSDVDPVPIGYIIDYRYLIVSNVAQHVEQHELPDVSDRCIFLADMGVRIVCAAFFQFVEYAAVYGVAASLDFTQDLYGKREIAAVRLHDVAEFDFQGGKKGLGGDVLPVFSDDAVVILLPEFRVATPVGDDGYILEFNL